MKPYLAAASAILLIAAAVFAQPDKDIIGTWKMDVAEQVR